jgi:hypothetical protein
VLAGTQCLRTQGLYFVLSFRLEIKPYQGATRCDQKYAGEPVGLTIPRWSFTKREEATNIFSPFLIVCNKTSLQKRFADLSDAPTFRSRNNLQLLFEFRADSESQPCILGAHVEADFTTCTAEFPLTSKDPYVIL